MPDLSFPWSIEISLPDNGLLPVTAVTSPGATASTGVPIVATMSRPTWALGASPLVLPLNPRAIEGAPAGMTIVVSSLGFDPATMP